MLLVQGHKGASGGELLRIKGALQFSRPSIVNASFTLFTHLAQASGTVGRDDQSLPRDGYDTQKTLKLTDGHVDDVHRVCATTRPTM